VGMGRVLRETRRRCREHDGYASAHPPSPCELRRTRLRISNSFTTIHRSIDFFVMSHKKLEPILAYEWRCACIADRLIGFAMEPIEIPDTRWDFYDPSCTLLGAFKLTGVALCLFSVLFTSFWWAPRTRKSRLSVAFYAHYFFSRCRV
jgi:hypothetical protein